MTSRPGGRLAGKVAIVTGAGGRQGKAITALFLAEGAAVVATDIVSPAFPASDAACSRLAHDVAIAADWAAAVAEATKRFGRLDILINNAAIFPRGSIEAMDEAAFTKVFAVNQLGVWLGMRAVLPAMRAAGGGSIVNTSSLAGLVGMADMSAYVASKHAVRGMSKSAAAEFGRDRIRVNAVFPGTIVSPHDGFPQHGLDRLFGGLPLGRPGASQEVARMMLFLASDEASYCTGAEFLIDGGALCNPAPPPSAQQVADAMGIS